MQTSLFKEDQRIAEGHANRGMALEQALKAQHEEYALRGLARIEKESVPSLPVKDGKWAKVIGKSTVDFVGVLAGGQFVAFDAKDCAGNFIELSRLQTHQLAFLREVDRLGGFGFVLVRYRRERCVLIPIRTWMELVEEHEHGGLARIREKDNHGTAMSGVDWLQAKGRTYDF